MFVAQARGGGQAVDLASLKRLQRYNQWQVDPLSLQDACRGISARCDLNAPWANATLNGYAAFGGIDCKVTDSGLAARMASHAVSGPTYDSQPIFWWYERRRRCCCGLSNCRCRSEAWAHVPHKELPLMYHFDWVEMQ